MTQIGNVPEINNVKNHLSELQDRGLIEKWELPYEHILTRLTAAIFFLEPTNDENLDLIWKELSVHKMLKYTENKEHKMSNLSLRVEFNEGFEI
jgi:6-pyruvoyl-tetrahydropterin synthase